MALEQSSYTKHQGDTPEAARGDSPQTKKHGPRDSHHGGGGKEARDVSHDTAHLPASPVCPQRVAGERTLAIPQTPTPTVRPLVRAIEAVVESIAQFAHVYAQLRAQAVVFVGLASRHLALRTCKTAKCTTVTTQNKSSTKVAGQPQIIPAPMTAWDKNSPTCPRQAVLCSDTPSSCLEEARGQALRFPFKASGTAAGTAVQEEKHDPSGVSFPLFITARSLPNSGAPSSQSGRGALTQTQRVRPRRRAPCKPPQPVLGHP